MTRLTTFASLFTALFVLTAPAISLAANDGEALPIYPHTNKGGAAREPSNEKAVAQAIVHGDNASLFTTDAPQAVDHRYQEKLPKSCARNAITATSIQYTCTTRGDDYTQPGPDAHHIGTQTLVE